MINEKLYHSSRLTDGDFEYIKLLQNISHKTRKHEIEDLLSNGKYTPKTSFIMSLEWNLEGFFGLRQNDNEILIPTVDYEDLSKIQILDKIINQINSLTKENFKTIERIYKLKKLNIEYKDELISVDEICRKNYDYILYKGVSNPSDYYADIYFEYKRSSEIIKIEKKDSAIIESLKEEDLNQLISKYR
ncbi:hypothetical protein [Flagellimonas marinaquae]